MRSEHPQPQHYFVIARTVSACTNPSSAHARASGHPAHRTGLGPRFRGDERKESVLQEEMDARVKRAHDERGVHLLILKEDGCPTFGLASPAGTTIAPVR